MRVSYSGPVPGGRTREEIEAELERIMEASGGLLTEKRLFAASRSPESPLYGLFERDDAKAAELYRLQQADDLLAQQGVPAPDDEVGEHFEVEEYCDDSRGHGWVLHIWEDGSPRDWYELEHVIHDMESDGVLTGYRVFHVDAAGNRKLVHEA